MTPSMACELIRQSLETSFWVALPLLAVGLIAGVAVSLFQIVTSMQDSTVGSVPRLAAFLIGLVLLLPWMLTRMMTYTAGLFADFGKYAR